MAHTLSLTHLMNHPSLNWMIRMTRLSWSGVDLFFVLSGFLIGGILLDARNSPNYFKTFYIRRAYRILPLYGLVLVLGWLIFQLGQLGWMRGGWEDLFSGPMPWWTFFTFTQNISMALAGPLVGRISLSQTWSLAVEEQFYLTLPLLIRYVPRRFLQYVALAFVVGASLFRVLLILYFHHGGYASYVLMPSRADALGLGIFSALLVREERSWSWLRAHRTWLYVLAGLGCFLLILISLSSFETSDTTFWGAEYLILGFFYTSLLLIAVTGEDHFVRTILCNRQLMSLGLIAYGTYMLHLLFLRVALLCLSSMTASRSAGFFFVSNLLGLGMSIFIAQLSWDWFEKPLVRRGHRYGY
jgi:peptidoglycan/LPS O-acetylase OafA/YrhL